MRNVFVKNSTSQRTVYNNVQILILWYCLYCRGSGVMNYYNIIIEGDNDYNNNNILYILFCTGRIIAISPDRFSYAVPKRDNYSGIYIYINYTGEPFCPSLSPPPHSCERSRVIKYSGGKRDYCHPVDAAAEIILSCTSVWRDRDISITTMAGGCLSCAR